MGKDPYKYFRVEAHDLVQGLSQGILEIERGTANKDPVGRLLRLAHTLKGAARVVKQLEIAELAHALEDALAPYRDGDGPVPEDRINELLRLTDAIRAHLAAIEAPPALGEEAPPRAAGEEPFRSVRVEIEEMDRLLSGIAEASVSLGAVHKGTAPLDEACRMARTVGALLAEPGGAVGAAPSGRPNGASTPVARARSMVEELTLLLDQIRGTLTACSERADRELGLARDIARQLRLVPASAIFGALERTARDAAHSLLKRARFEGIGGETHVDAHVLAGLQEVLLHVVRNAVAHGIEDDHGRGAAGKPPVGLVQLRVERRGSRVAFVCRDDGRGIDLDAVRRAARDRGLLDPAEVVALSPEQTVQLLFRGGVSTTATVTEISGRGVGLEIVREITARLKGEIRAQSDPGRGTTVEITVPASLASVTALTVEAAGRVVSLPLDSIRGAVRVTTDEIARSAEGFSSLLYEGQAIPFLPLSEVLGVPAPVNRPSQAWSAVILQGDSTRVAVGVDRLLAPSTVVMRPLPGGMENVALVAGAFFTAEGMPQLVLDPVGVVAAVCKKQRVVVWSEPPPRPLVLVIDDSLTTRMLEQTILVSAGYDVDLAISGEEALERARERRYALFVVDVEMPGMDGFQFIERTRADPELRDTPAILVTSRSSPEDRRRGEEVGARAYIVKSEFDESGFLRRIRDLIR